MVSKSTHVRQVTYEYTGNLITWHEDLRDRALSGEGGLGHALDRTTSYYLIDGAGGRFNGSGLSETIVGGLGNDLLSGKRGDDVILGSDGDDTLNGGHGSDTIYGDVGDDVLWGGQGDDTLVGGIGTNTIDGGSGVDTAVFGGVAEDYSISYAGEGVIVWSLGSTFINDILFNVEFLQFGYDTYDVNMWQSQSVSDPVQTSLQANAAPIATNDSFNALEDTVLSGSVLGNDGDANGDTLAVTAFAGATAQGGSVSVAADGTFTYTPAAHFSGADSFDYVVSDGSGGNASASVSLNVAGVADTPNLGVPAGLSATFANGTDTLSVPLDISASLTDNDGSELLRVRVSGLPSGAALSAGAVQADGSWLLEAGEIAGVTIDLPPTVAADFQLAIFAEAQEFTGGAIAVNEGTVTVDVVAFASGTPEPEPTPDPVPTQIDPDNIVVPGAFEGGNEIWVGAGQAYTDLQSAVDASGVNDTIYIAAGTYDFNQVKIDHDINIIGVGDVTLTAADRVYMGLLVTMPGASLYVENIDFTGTVSWDRNGAGIRHNGSDLTVVNSNFIGNENGILGTADDTGDVYIVESSFVDNGFGDGYSHGIYIKNVINLVVSDSTFIGTKIGHHVKSLADNTVVTNSVLDDANGQTSYSIEVSHGGAVTVEGNTIIQSADSENPGIISYSVARGGEPGLVTVSGNNIVNHHSSGLLVQNWTDVTVVFEGNVFSNALGGHMRMQLGLVEFVNNSLDGAVLPDSRYSDVEISGSSVADEMTGTSGNDVLNGAGGDDILWAGSATSSDGTGGNVLFGGSGNDSLHGGDGRDYLLGQSGDDFVDGGGQNDILSGGEGNDTLVGGSGIDTLIGGAGNDILAPGSSLDIVNGGLGIDVAVMENAYSEYRVWTEGGRWFMNAGPEMSDWGRNKVADVELFQFSDGVFSTITGAFHAGVILTTYADATTGLVSPLSIPEELVTSPEGSKVTSSSLISVSSSEPTVKSFEGVSFDGFVLSQTLLNQASMVTIDGTTSSENILGTNVQDVISGNGGKDIMYGDNGDDIYIADSYDDRAVEETAGGNDTFVSSAKWTDLGSNVETFVLSGSHDGGASGSSDDNIMLGNSGNNILRGGGGDDQLFGGLGADELKGGLGSDVFLFDHNNSGKDTIVDFDVTSDFVYLSAGLNGNTINSAETAVAALYDDASGNAILDLGGGNTVTFLNVSAANLGADDFVFGP